MTAENGLICAYRLDGKGGGELIEWDAVRSHDSDARTLWVHLDRKSEQAQQWLKNEAGLEAHVCEAMLQEDTRPRVERMDDGVLMILRGVNLNAGADPEDMISIRMWVESQRIVSLRYPRLQAVQSVRDSLEAHKGPQDAGDFVVQLIDALTDRMDPVIAELEAQIEQFEAISTDESFQPDGRLLSELRRRAITLRRYVAPQREAVSRLQIEPLTWLDDARRARLRESVDQIRRYVEDLDLACEHVIIIQDQMQNRMSERMNRTMYLLSIIAAIFLPLGLLTGLLGINVGGIPGVHSDIAFWVVCVVLLVLAFIQIRIFRRMRFF